MKTSVWIAVVCQATHRVLVAKRGSGSRNSGQWNFFGGGLDRGERPEKSARRELREESGINVAVSRLIPLAESTTGGKRNLLYGLMVTNEVKPRLNKESEESRWVSLAELTAHRLLHPPTQLFVPVVVDWLDSLGASVEPDVERASEPPVESEPPEEVVTERTDEPGAKSPPLPAPVGAHSLWRKLGTRAIVAFKALRRWAGGKPE